MYFDTHAHLNFHAFKEDAEQTLKDCIASGTWVANVGTQQSTSQRAVELANKFEEGAYAVIGLHPIHLFSQKVDEEESSFEAREERFDYAFYRELASDKKVVAIGECGLEYYHMPQQNRDAVKAKQREVFIQQIELAADVGKTLMIHSRDAYEDIYDVVKDRVQGLRAVIIHSFIGSREQAEKFVDIGCYISFNGIITYKPRKEKKPGGSEPGLTEAVEMVPLDRVLLETDCPYLSPEPVRGTRNTPQNVRIIAEKIALVKSLEVSTVELQTSENALKAFGIKK